MVTDWNDAITLVMKKGKQKFVVPRAVIKYLGSKHDRDYSGGVAKDIEVTVVHLDLEWAKGAGICVQHSDLRDTCVGLDLDMDFKVVLGLLRGDKAAEILF